MDEEFYTYKKSHPEAAIGAEAGSTYWAERAKAAYPNDRDWIKYLGWATHYLADALCPPHCYEATDQDIRNFWESWQRHSSFETYFGTLDAVELTRFRSCLASPCSSNLKGPDSSDIDTLSTWVVERAEEVRVMAYKGHLPPYLGTTDLEKIFSWIGVGIRALYTYVTQPGAPLPVTPVRTTTATVLLMDVSGSMASRWQGGVKIESAKKAALQFIEQVANEPRSPGTTHMIGVVTFSSGANVVCPLTDSYASARNTLISLGTLSSTNVGAGLDAALQELEKVPSGRRFIILLSDGMTNIGKTREQILSTSVSTAHARGICIHTVGFGDKGDIDADFLGRIASGSGCGMYNYAASGFELFGTYVKVRHSMLGSNRIVDFNSGPSPVRLLPGQSATLGAFQLTSPAQELHYTLAWSEPGRMRAILVDPSSKQVTASYPGATLYSGNGFTHITVMSPKTGVWRVSAAAVTSFAQGVQYYGIASARTGGIVIPYHIPNLPCIEILGTEICIPVPDLPTPLVVGIAVVAVVVVVYLQLAGW